MPVWMVKHIDLLYTVIFGMTFFCLLLAGVAVLINKFRNKLRKDS